MPENLFKYDQPWVKKKISTVFDVTIGFFDGAVCEHVGVHLLDQLRKHFNPASIGLYRDDGEIE